MEPTVTGLTRHAGMHQFTAAGVILGSGVLVGLLLSRVVFARLRRSGLLCQRGGKGADDHEGGGREGRQAETVDAHLSLQDLSH